MKTAVKNDHFPKKEALLAIQKLPAEEVYRVLGTNEAGLSALEVETRLQQYGKNRLAEKQGNSLIIKFLSNFTHLMALLLWAAGLISLIAKMPQLAIAIWMVNLINGIFSFWQEFRAGKATEALKKMLPDQVRLRREGRERQELAENLVPGDILLLSEGDKISADARLVADTDLRVNQSALTGESHPVHKNNQPLLREDLAPAEETNMVFAGTTVAAGSGVAVVYATGMSTEFGKIAHLTQSLKDENSPLQNEMAKLTKKVSAISIGIGIVFFFLAIFLAAAQPVTAFIFALGMIVAFIPEGLLPTVTLSLAMGVQRMAKRNALMKRLSAVETLGCTTVICTDKTGTLTQNEMTVSELWLDARPLSVTGVGYDPTTGSICQGEKPVAPGETDLIELLRAAALCCNARLVAPTATNNSYTVLGDPTEAALLVLAEKYGLDLASLRLELPRLRELPFDSVRKRMSTIHQLNDQTQLAFVKGAPKEVLELCRYEKKADGLQELTDDGRAEIMAVNDAYARKGLRVLAIAQRDVTALEPSSPELLIDATAQIEQQLTFLGLMAIVDPPRPEVATAVKKCHNAGIRIVMITGDYGLTAESIARRIGIVKGEALRIVTGFELEKMTFEELKQALSGEVIFARIAPDQKLQVVSALQKMKQIVAVTGDGVNDAPALKKADIGVAMGISGTDVAKEAADMILTDDNFASIVNAVEEGRAVYNNIRKFVLYIFNSNIAEAVPMVIYLFSRGKIPLPLTIMQILAIDLGTDMVPAMGLGVERPEKGIMFLAPRSQKESLLNRPLMLKAFAWYGLLEAIFGTLGYFFLNYLYGWPKTPLATSGPVYQMATTLTLAAIVIAQAGAVFGCRTERLSVFQVGFFSNHLILVGILVEISLLCLLIYLPLPFIHSLFNTAALGWREWVFLLFIPPLMLVFDESRKALLRKFFKKV